MKMTRSAAAAAALTMTMVLGSCSLSDKLAQADPMKKKGATTTTASQSKTNEKLFYDDFAATYKGNYYAELTMQLSEDVAAEVVVDVLDNKVYQATTVAGMTTYILIPGDGSVYDVSKETLTYYQAEELEKSVAQNDVIFGATGEFEKVEQDKETGFTKEYFKLNDDNAADKGEVIYSFDAAGQLMSISTHFASGAEQNYKVNTITAADPGYVQVPDLTGYTKNY